MKAKVLLLFASFICWPAAYAFGQVDCTNSNKLVCELPVTSSILNPNNSPVVQAQERGTGNTIDAAFATQLSQLPIPSATVGVVSLRQKGSQFGIPFENLGPILTDRPDTVGRGHLFAGFSYQHFNFNKIDGLDLSDLKVSYTATQTISGDDAQTFYGSVSTNVAFQLDQYVALLTYGATRTTDVSVVIPINNVSLAVTASNFQTFLYDSKTSQYFSVGFPAGTVEKTAGTASGIGDIIINVKQLIYGIEGSRPAVAVGGSLRVPTGDELNYLGSGAWGGNAFGLFSYRARISPHAKLSYQWNGHSDLTNGQALPGGLQYDAGADIKVIRPLTLAADVLGSQFINTPSLTASTLTLTPAPTAAETSIPASLSGVVQGSNTYSTANLSAGLKWSPLPHLLLYGSVLIPINDAGLRSDPVPLYGIAYNLRLGRR